MIPQSIIQAEFGAHPLCLQIPSLYLFLSFLRRVQTLGDSASWRAWCPYPAPRSSKSLASTGSTGRSRCCFLNCPGYFSGYPSLLTTSPPLKYSLYTLRNHLPSKQGNQRGHNILRLLGSHLWRVSALRWLSILSGFLQLRDGLNVGLAYTWKHWMHTLRNPLGQFWVGSHRFRVETDHHLPHSDNIC